MSCKQCGKCCEILSTIILTNEEVDSNKFLMAKQKVDGEIRLKQSTKGHCIYLKDNKCSIHNQKPTICKQASCPKQEGYLGFAKEDS